MVPGTEDCKRTAVGILNGVLWSSKNKEKKSKIRWVSDLITWMLYTWQQYSRTQITWTITCPSTEARLES